MRLKTRQWGQSDCASRIVCIHGLTHNSLLFQELGERFSASGRFTIAVDLRGHGSSPSTPPWTIETHVDDVLETIIVNDARRVILVGHSFGGRIAATIAARIPAQVDGVVLLESPPRVPEERARQAIAIEQVDWSFATLAGVTNAALSSDLMVVPSQRRVEEFVKQSVRRGADGRYRFGYCPDAVIEAWKEMTRPPPTIAAVPTLIVNAEVPLADPRLRDERYETALGGLLSIAEVPHGHNVLWEAPDETISIIEQFAAGLTGP